MAVTIRRLLRTERVRLLTLSLSMALWFLVMMLVIRTSADDVVAKSQLFDSALTRGFGLGALVSPDAIIAQLTGISFNHPIVLALLGAATIGLGARSCQGELLDGTLDVTLARALSRTKYLLGYVVVIALAVVLLMAVSWASMVGFDRLLDVPGTLDAGRAAMMCINAAAVFFGFGAIALLVSVLLGRRGSAMFVSVGILVVMYAITFVDRLWSSDVMDVLGPMSLFHWFDPGATLAGVEVEPADVLAPLGVSIACIVLATWRFERRDL